MFLFHVRHVIPCSSHVMLQCVPLSDVMLSLVHLLPQFQFTYLYYALKACTLFVKKKYILLNV